MMCFMPSGLRNLLTALLLAAFAAGCGSDVTPGLNKDKDKPRPAEAPAEKK